MESEIRRLVDQIERAHAGDPWHGSSLTALLEGVTVSQAASHPVPGGHSIWEIVLHVTGWTEEVRRRLAGAPAAEPERGDWPAVGQASDARWRAALDGLHAAHRDLIGAVAALPEDDLYKPTNDPRNRALGTGVTRYELLHGLVQHDAYHAGQIAQLRRALR